jgi:glutamine cyclotransferase
MQRLITPLALCAAVALSLLGAPAQARQSSHAAVAPAFGNTVVSTYPDGRKARLWLKEGGTYTATGRRGKPSSGVWSLKGAKICLKQKKPVAGPFSFCTETPSGGIGSSWKAKAVTGEPVTVTVIKGRV